MALARQTLQNLRTERADLTDWAIHWTRNAPDTTALQILLEIIADGVLLPGYARRGEPPQPTIYGPRPAVCFTEQPLLEFARYVAARQKPEAVTGYGIAVHREDLYAEGGLPVISGLLCPCEAKPGDEDYEEGRRNLRVACGLPLDEQFRFVRFAPNKHNLRGTGGELLSPLDWTHEREWRWPEQDYVKMEDPDKRIDGFPLGGSGYAKWGTSEGRFHIIVEKDANVAEVQQALNRAVEQTTFSRLSDKTAADLYRTKIPKARIFSLETVRRETVRGANEYAKIESYPYLPVSCAG